MKMAHRKNHKPAIWSITLIIVMILSCNFPSLSQNSSPEAETLPEIPTLEETSQPMLPTPPSPADQSNPANCFAEIYPGQTTKAEVIVLLGEPVATQQEGRYETLQYASPLRGQYNTVYLQSQVVDWISLVLTEDYPLTWSAVKAQYGEPVHTAYSDYLQGSHIFAFPEQGLNFIADDQLDVVFIQECYIPMSLQDYMMVYGDFLLQDDPFTK